MRRSIRSLGALALTGTVGLLGACSSAQPATENVGTSAAAISQSTILSRADQWVQAQLLYCQSPNGASDTIDPSCPSVCVRESNSAWDPYRSDCSGFISWAWGLAPPGNTTDELAPADTSVSYVIQGSDLQPGDALNIPGDHTVLFVSWVTVGTEANFYEEPGCSATPNYAHAFTSAVTINGSDVTVAYEGSTFTAIRYTGVTASDGGVIIPGGGDAGDDAGDGIGTPCTVTESGQSGVCLDTSTCAAMAGGVSTPGYCPGPDNVECCTGVMDAGTGAVDASTGGSGDDAGAGAGVDAGSGSAPGSGTSDAGVTPKASDAGSAHGAPGGSVLDGAVMTSPGPTPADASDLDMNAGGFGPAHSGGCSVSGAKSGPADGVWMLGLGVMGLVFSGRRRNARR